jgi:F-box-like
MEVFMISTTNHITSLPYDPTCKFLSCLDVKDLGRAAQVCAKWAICATNDSVWEELFLRAFSAELPKNMSAKTAVFICGLPLIENMHDLFRKYVSFRCNLEEDKKRELVCFSDNKQKGLPVLFTITQGVGSYHGTNQWSGAPADEKEMYRIPDSTTNFLPITYFYNPQFQNKPYENNANIESNLNGINICTNISTTHNLFSLQFSYLGSDIAYSHIKLRNNVFDDIVIKNLNVGWGNTLGYCSNINNWKKPFKFSCIDGKWSGRVPSYMGFTEAYKNFTPPNALLQLKFVKIGPEGKITWETCENRNCDISNYIMERGFLRNYFDHPFIVNECWNDYLQDFPINFQT